MKKRILILSVALLIAGMLAVGATYAFLASKSRQVINTFVSGDIKLTLTETTGSEYILVPGTSLNKDPRITVSAGSEECWLFFKVKSDATIDSYITYSVESGWNALAGETGVYWRRVQESSADTVYKLLSGDRFTVNENVTEEKLASLGSGSMLTFTAYAVQYDGISTPEQAWEIIKSEGDEA